MPTPLEAEISTLLKTKGDAVAVADELIKRWARNLLSEDERTDVAQYLVASGLLQLFFKEALHQLDLGAKLPWPQVIEALGRSGLDLDEYDTKSLFDAAAAQGATTDMVRSHALDHVHPGFKHHREAFVGAKLKEASDRRQALLDKLHYMRAHRLFDQEGQVLDELQALFPGESEFQVERDSLKLRWAREIVSKSTAATDPTAALAWRIESLPPDQLASKKLIVARAMELAQNDPRLAYDLAVSLHMMDLHADALEVLANAARTHATDWLRLEIMIRGRQFVNALEEATRLEVAYADDPDTAFAVTYARARSLHGLGQVQQGIELLRSLINIRPHYRSAQSLLSEWAGGEA